MKKFFSWRTAILKSGLTSSSKLLLLTLACHMNDAGESCFPSIPLLAEETSMNERTVYRQLALCEQLGWIKIKKMGFAGAQWSRNSYTISWPPDVDKLLDLKDGPRSDHHERGDTMSGLGGDTGSGLGVTQDQGRGDTVSGLGVTQDHPNSTGINSTLNSPDKTSLREVGASAADATPEEDDLEEDMPTCPHTKIIQIYHEVLSMCPQVKTWTKNREQHLRQRWKEDKKRQTLEWWRSYFEYVAKSKFLTAQVEGRNGKPPFLVNLEWLVRPSNLAKVVEGNYHRIGV